MFWLKFGGVSIAVLALVIVGIVFLGDAADQPEVSERQDRQERAETVYDRWDEDGERLRSPVEPQDKSAEEPEDQIEQPDEPQEETPEESPDEPRQFRELTTDQQYRAEQLLEQAITSRQQTRLPGFTWRQTIDYCRQIIDQFPDTEYELKAQRILAEIPRRDRRRWDVADEELGPYLEEAEW